MSAIKTGAVANNRFAVIIDRHHKHLTREIPVDRSGGGLWRGQSIIWARAPFLAPIYHEIHYWPITFVVNYGDCVNI